MATMQWIEDAVSTDGVVEQGFAVEREGYVIPGVCWRPPEPAGHQLSLSGGQLFSAGGRGAPVAKPDGPS